VSQLPVSEFSLGKRAARDSSYKDNTDTINHYLNQEDGDIIM
jgi:hypothetical protein